MSDDDDERVVDGEFQDWWQRAEVQQEIRSIQTLTGGSLAEACLVVMMAQVAGQLDALTEDR